MGHTIRIIASPVKVTAELNDTKTAQAIWDALPIKGRANLWGDEIYFPIPLSLELEDGKELVNVGDLGYWPTGSAFCIFFGPTPMSRRDEVRPASAVNVFGKVAGDATFLKQVASGTEVTIEKESEQ
ncbi:cyclophilin-like fold protein [Chloroflexota bacterium]